METDDATPRTQLTPRNYVQAAWVLLGRDPLLVGFKAFADFAQSSVRALALVLLVLIFLARFGAVTAVGRSPAHWLAALPATLTRPGVFLGISGMVFAAWMIGFVIQCCAYSAVWGAYSRGVVGDDIEPVRTFWQQMQVRFPDAVRQRTLLLVTDLWLLMAAITIVVPVARLAPRLGEEFGSPHAVPALAWAVGLTAYCVFALIVRLTAELAAAPMFMQDTGIGEAIYRAALVVSGHAGDLYLIFVRTAGVLVVPLAVYCVAVLFQNLAIDAAPAFQDTATFFGFLADVFLLLGVAAFAVSLQGALFSFYADHAGLVSDIPGAPRTTGPPRGLFGRLLDRMSGALRSPVRAGSGQGEPTLTNLLPDAYPYVADVDDILADTGEPSETSEADDEGATTESAEERPADAEKNPPKPTDSEEEIEDSSSPEPPSDRET